MSRSFAMTSAIVILLNVPACGPANDRRADTVPEELSDRIAAVENELVPRDATPLGTEPSSLQERMERYRVPGVSVAIIADGEIDWAKGYGVLREGAAEIVDTTTLFQGASISKVVTTVGILRLLEQGRLTLDEDVNAYLSSWKVPESHYTRESKVTLRRILTHSAGLTVSGFLGYEPVESLPTLDEVLDGQSPANSSPIRVDFVPGTNQRYSGGGFTVAQQLIQDITNEPFEDALDDLVLRPRGMTNSTFEQPLPIDRESEAASGHDRTGSVIPGRWHIHPEKAAAGLWSTPSDLARLVLSIQRSAAGQDGEVLLPATTQEMLATQMGPSGLGFVVLGEGDGRIFRHGGANVGFRALVVGYASGSHGAVVMTNGENGMELIDEIVASVARVYEWPDR